MQYGYIYALRCLMKIQPLKNLFGLLFCSMLAFAYILKICESANKSTTMDFSYYFNALWCVIITMTTSIHKISFLKHKSFKAGYGDFYATTPLGRTFSILIAFFGIFIVSITVVTITNLMELNKTEMKSMNLLLRLEERKILQSNAAKFVSSIVAFKYYKRKHGYNQLICNAYKVKIKQHKNDFSENIRSLKCLFCKTINFFQENQNNP